MSITLFYLSKNLAFPYDDKIWVSPAPSEEQTIQTRRVCSDDTAARHV